MKVGLMDEIEELIKSVQFHPADLLAVKLLDKALTARGGTRLEFMISALREGARQRLEVPHHML